MRKKIYIEGMSCQHCVKRVKSALEEIGGKDLKVEVGVAEGNFPADDGKIKGAIEEAGYSLVRIE